MIEKKHVSMFIVLMLLASLAMISVPVQSPPVPVTYAVEMPPEGYIPGVTVGQIFEVNVTIDASSLTPNSAEGIIGWRIDVQVDPDVLEVMGARGGNYPGYEYCLINQFITDYYPTGYWGDFIIGSVNKAEGYIDEISELINPAPPGGAGGTGVLCTLGFKSKSDTAYSRIKITIYEDGVWQPVYKNVAGNIIDAVAIDGYYGSLSPYSAEIVRKKAWPEHHHFDISKDDGYCTMFGKVRNLGDLNVLVKVVFEVKGPKPLPLLETNNMTLIPGQIEDLTADIPLEFGDEGLYKCLAYAMYLDPGTESWELGTATKATKFNVVT